MTGIVFDVQRFALHDGPGIRTTVFLKGCPLRCLWCHNPESQAFAPQLAFGAEERAAHDPSAHRSLAKVGAVIGRKMTVEEVMDEVLRDEAYYHRSGGGLTLSGGEPLAQPTFALALLREAKAYGLHTCLDTSGVVAPRWVEAAADLTDLFLYDYKATDPDEHRRLTGASNRLVLDNLDLLYRRGARVRLRCPLVPGLNDTPEHLEGIAALADRYPDLEGIEIMPYHDLGRDKAARIGREYALSGLPSADEAAKAGWLDWLHALGCTQAVLG